LVSYANFDPGTSGEIETTGAKIGDFKVEYLRQFEAICKKALTRESGAQVGLFDEKTRGRKSRGTVPLRIKTFFLIGSS
jgi:hypothetical protein